MVLLVSWSSPFECKRPFQFITHQDLNYVSNFCFSLVTVVVLFLSESN